MAELRTAEQSPVGTEPDPQTLLGALVLLAIAVVLVARFAARHPFLSVLCAVAVTALGAVAVAGRARWKDARAARSEPEGPGLIIGTTKGDWRLARRRPFYVPWPSLLQHVLICGPTGRGKTFTFITPVLDANAARPGTGVFYLDGKGDRIDQRDGDQPGVAFDHVFCPADPAGSACWNPLAGTDPVQAARDFAAALYPEAAQASANFYETRAVFAITRVAPALALTGYAADEGSMWNVDADEAVEALTGAGVEPVVAGDLVRRFGAERCMQQIAWLAHRRAGANLAELIRRNHAARAARRQRGNRHVGAAQPGAVPARRARGLVERASPGARDGDEPDAAIDTRTAARRRRRAGWGTSCSRRSPRPPRAARRSACDRRRRAAPRRRRGSARRAPAAGTRGSWARRFDLPWRGAAAPPEVRLTCPRRLRPKH